MEKKVVSPFEFAICEAIDPQEAKKLRPETIDEKSVRLKKEMKEFFSKIKVKS